MMASTRVISQAMDLLVSARSLHWKLSATPTNHELKGEIIFKMEGKLEDVPSLACLPDDTRRELDLIGTSLWNTCGQLAIVRCENREDQKVLSRAKTVAFILIDAIAPNDISGNLRSLKVALSTARFCIGNRQLRLAHRILESGAQRLDSLKRPGTLVQHSRLQSFSVEYFALRAHLAWLRCRPDVADHLFWQIPPESCIASRKIVVNVCYNVGCHAMSKHQHGEATKWLKRAIETMPHPQQDNSTEVADFENLNLLVRHTLARICLKINTAEAGMETAKQLEILKREHKEALAVKFLQLEVILNEADRGLKTDTNEFFKVLETITSSVQLTRETFLSILAFVNFSQSLSQELSLKALQSLLAHLPIGNSNLVESGFIKLSNFAVESQASEENRLACIRETAKALEARGMKPLSTTTAHACLIFIWKHIDRVFRQGQYPTAGNWCQLVLDTSIFRDCSELNMLTIRKYSTLELPHQEMYSSVVRKLALCALKGHNPALAHEVLDKMSLRNSLNPERTPLVDLQVLYLKFRLSVQEGQDTSGVSDCMRSLYPEDENFPPHCPFGQEFSQMCALEAQLHDSPQEGMAWVQMLLSEGGDQTSDTEELLFSIFLLTAELERGPPTEPNVVLMLKLLKLVFPITCRPEEDEDSLADRYLEWICRASYTLTRDLLKAQQTVHVEEALSATQELFLKLQSKPSFPVGDTGLLRFRLAYLAVTWHILKIRSGNCSEEEKRTRYSAISKLFKESRTLRNFEDDHTSRLFRHLWAIGLEAAIFNGEWAEVLRCSQELFYISDQTMLSQLVESMLTLDMPQGLRVYILQKIICWLYEPQRASASLRHLFPFYLRVIFELCLAAENPDEYIRNLFGGAQMDVEMDAVVGAQMGAEMDDEMDAEIVPEDNGLTFLAIAELTIDQATVTATDEAYIMSEEHCRMHVEETETGPRNSICGQFPYPKEELVHLAVVAFNQAVDFYSRERDAECQRWAGKAIRLAELAGGAEGTKLAGDLRRRLAALF